MIRPLTRRSLVNAVTELANADPALATSVERYGAPPLWAREPSFATLIHLILEQQVSLASARAAFDRLDAALDGSIRPQGLLTLSDSELRTIGFSRQKARYARDLATALTDGFDLDGLAHQPDDEVRASLMRLRGVGRWTADIYLIMCLRRPDVWPHGRAVAIEEVAAQAGLTCETAREAADLVASVGMAQIDEGIIIGMDGLTTRRTRHRLVVGGVGLWTWCAYDVVGIAAALVADAVGSTQCGGFGLGIKVVIRKGRLDAGTAVVGWLPDASCSNVMAEFCPSALLFCSRSHLDQWRAREGIGSGAALDVESLAERGRSDWRQLVP
jgi:DNA-3-methyladenine glycosylase II